METRCIAIVGPTAVGKSDLALRLAEALGGEIVSADALQVYRGFDVGTAKPSLDERQRIPHHLVDILEPSEAYSAGEFVRRAEAAIEQIHRRGRPAVVVGGSGLYFRALGAGIAALPPVDPAIRRELEHRRRSEGLEPLRRELEQVDPATASRLAARDAQRILRALEVFCSSGVPLSTWISRQPFGRTGRRMIKIGLTLPRALLYDRIATRAHVMLESGWLNEVRGLLDRGVERSAPAFQAIGYRHLGDVVAGLVALEEAIPILIRATQQFAKRQETWFRREPGIEWRDAGSVDREFRSIVEKIGATAAGG